jgi:GWxTD domain-containing protein
MRFTRHWLRIELLILFVLACAIESAADERLERLPPEYRTWLEEEVVYIISDAEKDVFLSLGTMEERDRFIEAFWRVRDPDPATKENEFLTEHYRRLEYAGTKLSPETARPGWKTDRGRMYILLGEPRQITRFESQNEVVQCELWVYEAQPEKGLPSSFNLLFFRRRSLGEYELYNPVLHGPNALMTGYQYTPASDNAEALQVLQRISPDLARASLTLDLGEPVDFGSRRPAFGTDILMSRIEASAKRNVRTDYAEAYLRYGNRVSADYSFRYVPNENGFSVLYGPDSTPFVHFTVELSPQNFALQVSDDGSKYYTTLDVTREVRTKDGVLVALDEQEAYLELPPNEFQKGARLPFAYQDAFPLVPGDYRVSVVLRNRAVHQFTVAERSLEVAPLKASEPGLGGLVVGYLHERPLSEEAPGHLLAFQAGYHRVYPAVSNLFPTGAELVALAQVHGARAGSRLRFSLLEGEAVLDERETGVDEESDEIVQKLTLPRIAGGDYGLRVQLFDPDGLVLEERLTPVVVSPRSAVDRPGFIYRRGFPQSPGALALARGEQLWSLERYEEATAELRQAVAEGGPLLPEASWKLAGALLSAKRSDEALELLLPLEERFRERYEVVAGLGFAYYFRQDYSLAREFLERAASLRPPDSALLNALGDSYGKLGERERAIDVYRRSLELDPTQEEVQELLQSLGEPK